MFNEFKEKGKNKHTHMTRNKQTKPPDATQNQTYHNKKTHKQKTVRNFPETEWGFFVIACQIFI